MDVKTEVWASALHKGQTNRRRRKKLQLETNPNSTKQVLRVLDNSRIKDKRSICEMLRKFNMLSVNQTAAQIKLTEAWKSCRTENYPVKLRKTNAGNENPRQMRTGTRRELEEGGRNRIVAESFAREAGRLWNAAPNDIKIAKTIGAAKKAIAEFCKTLPI